MSTQACTGYRELAAPAATPRPGWGGPSGSPCNEPTGAAASSTAPSQATAATVLNDLGELVRGGHVLAPGDRVALRSGDVHLLTFPESGDWLYAANDLYGGRGPVPALLVVPADELEPTPGDDQPCAFCG